VNALTRLAALGLLASLLAMGPTPALAGVEPQPWQPAVNRLDAATNDLAAVRSQLMSGSIRMGIEPSPWKPAVNHLDAIHAQLGVLYGRVDSALTGVPRNDPDVSLAMAGVNSAAQAVIDDAEALHEYLPEQCDEALNGVVAGAGSIVKLTTSSDVIP
jgi:hypothetical protein